MVHNEDGRFSLNRRTSCMRDLGAGAYDSNHVSVGNESQTLRQVKPEAMAVNVEGELAPGCTARISCSASSGSLAPAAVSAR